MHSTEIKRRLWLHKGDRDLMRKQIKDSVPCDKIIMCRDKIRCTQEKVLSPLRKSTDHNRLCLWCQRKEHNANSCKAFPPSSTHCTQNIHNAETSSPSKEKQHTKLEEYVNSLKTSGKTDDEIFSTLRMCYKEPEELDEVSTYPDGVHKAQDF